MSYPRIPNVIELELHWCHVCMGRLVPAVVVKLAGATYYFCEEHQALAAPFADGHSGTPAVVLSDPIIHLEDK